MIKYRLSRTLTSLMGFTQYFLNNFRSDIPKRAILVSGVPRSGTTWLSEILLTIPGYKLIFEPLKWDWYPQFSNAYSRELSIVAWKPEVRPYVFINEDNPKLRGYLNKVFSNKVIPLIGLQGIIKNSQKQGLNYFKTLVKDSIEYIYKYPLVKFVRGNRLLPWIAKNFQLRGIYMEIRHPCATIHSYLKTFKQPNISLESFKKHHLLRDVTRIRELENLESRLIRKVYHISSWYEALASLYAIDYFVPLCYQRSKWWYTVIYEKLVLEQEDALRELFKFLGENIPDDAYTIFRRASRTARKQRYSPHEYLNEWKYIMPRETAEKIINVLGWFEMNFYEIDKIEPDYKLLYNWTC